MIKTENLSMVFTTEEVQTKALNEVNIEVKQSEFVAIMGPSGCGKSTLLNILGTLDSPTSGKYFFNGKEIDNMGESQLTAFRKGNIGFVFQSFNLIDELTVFENVELPLVYLGCRKSERKRKVMEVLDRMNIAHRAGHFPQQLSGGQQQRVAIARAVVTDCPLILADEPTGNLTYVAFEYSYDDMHSRQDRIFRVEARFYENGELTDDWASSSAGYATAMKQNMSAVEAYTRVGSQYYPEQVVKYNELLYRETGIGYAEANFFDFFDFKLLKGNKESCLDGPNKVVITERIARKYFKGADPIGKILIFRSNIGEEACEVTGIMEDMPINTHIRYNLLISYKTLPKWMDEYWYRHEVYSYVLLKSANLKTQVEEDFPVMAEKYKTEEALKNKTWAIQLTNLRDIHLNPQKAYEPEVKGNRSSIWVLICTALAILCIAWINYINMTVARSMERAKEIGIRRASGASRRQVISQFLFESLVTNSIAFILAIGLMEALMPSFNNQTGRDLSFSVWFTTSLGWYLLLIFAAGVFLSGFYPATVLSGIKPIRMLKGKFTHTHGATVTRKVLVVLRYTASLVLL